MKSFPTKINSLFTSIIVNRELILGISKRNIIGKYKGSIFGLLWSFLNPLILLSVYTFAFSVVFKAKWGVGEEGHFDFALILFSSLIVFNIFSDAIKDSPTVILANANYVKKVIFPLEILPVVNMITALFHAMVSVLIFFVFYILANSHIVWTAIFFPIVLIPLVLITLGTSFFLASIGVYIRDIGYMINHLLTILLFVSPIFFSMERLPKEFQKFIFLNPIAYIIEESRNVLIFGKIPQWNQLLIYTCVGIVSLVLGYIWFQKTRTGFADVI